MKDVLIILILFGAVIFALPLLSGANEPRPDASPPPVFPGTVRIYMTESGNISEVTAEEYIEGCLAAVTAHDLRPEALKAQAAVCATYSLRLMTELTSAGKLPNGADISDDKTLCQPYMTEPERKSKYGAGYEEYHETLQKAAQWGLAHIITYDGEPIYAVYCPLSAGATCPSEYIWGRAFPYLRRAESSWDRSSINFECVNEYKSEEIRSALARYSSDIEIPVDPARWFTDMDADESGYVISVNIGKNTFSGGDLWRILGLRSTSFTVSYVNNIFTFTTHGFGHGAGLSQYGANELAKTGCTAEEIIRHYYEGVVLT